MLFLEDYDDFNLKTLINLIYGGSILYLTIIVLIIKYIKMIKENHLLYYI